MTWDCAGAGWIDSAWCCQLSPPHAHTLSCIVVGLLGVLQGHVGQHREQGVDGHSAGREGGPDHHRDQHEVALGK